MNTKTTIYRRPGLADKILFSLGLLVAIFVLYVNYLFVLRKGG